MGWEAVGAIGEAIGAAGVVVSLLYLARQLRQNTLSVRSATYQSIVSNAAACNAALTQNRDVARVFREGCLDLERLDADARVQFSFLCAQIFDIFENLFLQHEHAAVEDDYWEPRARSYLDLLESPGIAAWWQGRRGDYSKRFEEFVEAHRSGRIDSGGHRSLFPT